MLPDPLHPAVVHFPIALAFLVPGLAILVLVAIGKGLLPARSWALVVLLQVALVGSGWLAIESGEDQEERVERVVAERHIEAHHEAAERFLVSAGIALLVCGVGLLSGRVGELGRVAGTLTTCGVLAMVVGVGHSGGDLVYKYGAASAYTEAVEAGGSPADADGHNH